MRHKRAVDLMARLPAFLFSVWFQIKHQADPRL